MRNPEEYFLEKYSRQIIMEQVGVEGQKKLITLQYVSSVVEDLEHLLLNIYL